jgi:hypothetical protein
LYFDPTGDLPDFPETFLNLRRFEARFLFPWRPTMVHGMAVPPEAWLQPHDHDLVSLILRAFWPVNFLHALVDDFVLMYRMLRVVGLDPDRDDVQLHFVEPGCRWGIGDPVRQERACRFHAEMSRGTFDRPFLVTPLNYTSVPASLSPAQVNVSDLTCMGGVVMGAGTLDYHHADHSFPEFMERFVWKLGGRSMWEMFWSGFTEQRVAVLVKSGVTRRVITNTDEIATAIRTELNVTTDLITFDSLAAMSLHDQIQVIHRYSVVVSPSGGGSGTTAFMRPGSAAIYVTYFDPERNGSGIMEEYGWTKDYRRLSTQMPLDREDITFRPEDLERVANGKLSESELWRNLCVIKVKTAVAVQEVRHALRFVQAAHAATLPPNDWRW